MIDFNSLELVNIPDEKIERVLYNKRYVLGSDPFIQNGIGKSVFSVYDKMTMSYVLKLKTNKKNFDQFVEWVMRKNVKGFQLSEREVVVSRKFITDAGTAIRIRKD